MRRLLPLTACLLVLTMAVPALAAAKPKSHSTKSSHTSTSNTLSPTPPGGVSTGSDSSSRTLPFTGLNLWASVTIGLGLLGTGLVLRRVVPWR